MAYRKSLCSLAYLAICMPVLAGLLAAGCSSAGFSKKGPGEGLSETDLDAQREERFGGSGIPLAEDEGLFRDINFAYDSSIIDEIGRQNVEANAQLLRDNPQLVVQLEGHCDERGTADYNLALGAERAKAVRDLLVSLGISASRLDTISYGEEVPLASGHDEESWAKNRRVHFSAHSGGAKRAAAEGAFDRY